MKNIFLLITVFSSGIYSQGILAQTIVKGLVKDGKGSRWQSQYRH
jgi:hypothetical protein